VTNFIIPSGTDQPVTAPPVAVKPFWKKKRFYIPVGVVTAFVLIGIAAGNSTPVVSPVSAPAATKAPIVEPTTKAPIVEPTTEAPVVQPVTKAPTTKPAPKKAELTLEQANAVRSAQSYLEFTAFSRKGLIRQLSSDAGEGYPLNVATFAVDSLHINYNEQAAKSAKSYLETMAFSRQGLIEQLSSDAGEGFTYSQAVYGVDKAGL
jgi:hypothetical protein